MSKVAFNIWTHREVGEQRECGRCHAVIPMGAKFYFFHPEEDDFCSESCLQSRYSTDEEAHVMTASGYWPYGEIGRNDE